MVIYKTKMFKNSFKKITSLSSKKTKEITDDELESYKDLAKDLFNANQNKIDKMIALGLLTEVKYD